MKNFHPFVPVLWVLLLLCEFYYLSIWKDTRNDFTTALLVLILPILLPIVISLLRIIQNLRQERGKILYKVPLDAAKVAIISSTGVILSVVGVSIFFNFYFDTFFLVLWVFLVGPSYILITVSVSFLICLAIYIWIRFTDASIQGQLAINEIKVEEVRQGIVEKGSIVQTIQRVVVAGIVILLAAFILRNTDFLHWLFG